MHIYTCQLNFQRFKLGICECEMRNALYVMLIVHSFSIGNGPNRPLLRASDRANAVSFYSAIITEREQNCKQRTYSKEGREIENCRQCSQLGFPATEISITRQGNYHSSEMESWRSV